MATTIAIPSLGMGMTEGKLAEWLVADGTEVAAGQIIYTLESEKSVQEVEAPVAGTLKIVAEPDNVYPVGHVIANIA